MCDVVMLYVLIHVAAALFFFFQAEDGIRDLVRSRGLGDVYKRQGVGEVRRQTQQTQGPKVAILAFGTLLYPALAAGEALDATVAVSYTHLTLPTSDLV